MLCYIRVKLGNPTKAATTTEREPQQGNTFPPSNQRKTSGLPVEKATQRKRPTVRRSPRKNKALKPVESTSSFETKSQAARKSVQNKAANRSMLPEENQNGTALGGFDNTPQKDSFDVVKTSPMSNERDPMTVVDENIEVPVWSNSALKQSLISPPTTDFFVFER